MSSYAEASKCWNTVKKINCKLSYIKKNSDFKQESTLTRYFKEPHTNVQNSSLAIPFLQPLSLLWFFCDSPLKLTKKKKRKKSRRPVLVSGIIIFSWRLDDLQSLGFFLFVCCGFFFPPNIPMMVQLQAGMLKCSLSLAENRKHQFKCFGNLMTH